MLDLHEMIRHAAHDAPRPVNPPKPHGCDGCSSLRLSTHQGHAGGLSIEARCGAVDMGRLIHWHWNRAQPAPNWCNRGRAQ